MFVAALALAPQLVRASALSDVSAIRPGRPFRVAVDLKIAPDWHTYWINPGDSGAASHVAWQGPPGFRFGALHWPVPSVLRTKEETSYVYRREVRLVTDVTPPKNLRPGQKIALRAQVDWLVCRDSCIPGKATVALTLPVGTASKPKAALDDRTLRIPQRRPNWIPLAIQTKQGYLLTLSGGAKSLPSGDLLFLPAQSATVEHGAPQPLSRVGDSVTLALRASSYAQRPAKRLIGVLVDGGGHGWQIDVPVRQSPQTPALKAGSKP